MIEFAELNPLAPLSVTLIMSRSQLYETDEVDAWINSCM